MRIAGQLIWAAFCERKRRFIVEVEHKGRRMECYLANPGRLAEILTPKRMLLLHAAAPRDAVPGERDLLAPNRMILLRAEGSQSAVQDEQEIPTPERELLLREGRLRRRTGYDVLAARMDEGLAIIDSRLPNRLVREALLAGALPEFRGFLYRRSEPPFGGGKLDFYLEPDCYLEVKGCTLVRDGVALFPDAPTLRGARQMMELQKAKELGYRACVLFVVGRGGARIFQPHWEMDPAYARALQSAWRSGVEVIAYSSRCQDREIFLAERMAVEL
jgi:sugar fermentation stimulation protein A